jgi:thiol-disulfide isomerase/thioredoxin
MSPQPTSSRPPVLAIAGGAFLLVVIIGLVVALATGGDDEGPGGDPSSTVDPDQATFGPVEVSGDPLPAFDGDAADDAALGLAAPVTTATTPDGREITFGAAGDPTLLVFLAHWCPHCQAELPVLVDMAADGDFEGVRTVAVLTGTNPDAPNFPPVLWLEDEGWEGEVALDDEAATAAAVHGLTSYPYLVMLDADGRVTGRIAGEQPREAVQDLVDSGR